jgi:hypothetical protein
MGPVFRLWVLAIAVRMYACSILLLGVDVEPFRRDVAAFLSACRAIVQHPRNVFGTIVLQAGKKPVGTINYFQGILEVYFIIRFVPPPICLLAAIAPGSVCADDKVGENGFERVLWLQGEIDVDPTPLHKFLERYAVYHGSGFIFER